jgi:hypothetical protein
MPSSSTHDSHGAPLAAGALPLVLGVTGHRDLREEELPALREQLAGVFRQLRRDHPHTPLCLLSPLAEGADRLAAEVALAEGAQLVVPLPMERALYERDFPTEESRAQFASLLDQAEDVFVLPLMPGSTAESIEEYGDARNGQYARAGAYVAFNCQLLIALWDGTSTGKVGGAWQIVGYMLEGVPEPYAPPTSALYDRESGPVYHIRCGRQSNATPAHFSPQLEQLYPETAPDGGDASALHRQVRQAVEQFNRDAENLREKLHASLAASRGQVGGLENAAAKGASRDTLADSFALADSMANGHQQRTLWVIKAVLALSLAAMTLLQLYLADLGSMAWLLPAYAASVAGGFACYWWAQWAGIETKHLDYRALAEGLRVQIHWRTAGLPHCTADYYLRRQRGVLEWVRNALRTWTMLAGEAPVDEASASGLSHVLRYWVEDQAGYFRRAGTRQRGQARRLGWWAQGLVVAGVVLAGLDFLLGPNPWFVVAAIVAPLAAALVFLYVNTRALREHANQYERMGRLFSDAAVKLRERIDADDVEGGRRLVFEIGREALAENADWVILHRDRPMEGPSMG